MKQETPFQKRRVDALYVVARMHESFTLERFRTILQAIPPPEIDFDTSFQSVDELCSSEVDDLLRKLKSLRIRVLRDSYMQSALIVSVVYRSLNVDLACEIQSSKLETFFRRNPDLGSFRGFYRHQGFVRFFQTLIGLAKQLQVISVEAFLDQLLIGLDRTQLDFGFTQEMVLELIFQRIARFSLLNHTIKFDSSIHSLCQGSGVACSIDGCYGTVWREDRFCWFHYLADVGVEVRFVSSEKEFGLFATRRLKKGLRLTYKGKVSKIFTKYSVKVTNSKSLDASFIHSCPARWINHSPTKDSNCKWVNGSNEINPCVEVVRDIDAGEELTIPYAHNLRVFVNKQLE